MMHITKEFSFDAAHQLGANVDGSHKYARVHGHSFDAELRFSGVPDPETGWICDFAALDAIITDMRGQLDHHYLNDIDGLAQPTLERLTQWIWDRVKPREPRLSQVTVRRGSCREGCVYTGPEA